MSESAPPSAEPAAPAPPEANGAISPPTSGAVPPPPVAAFSPDDPPDPADLEPPPTRRQRLAWYSGTLALATLLVCAGYRLDSTSLRAPLFYDLDSLLILPMVKSTIETGTHWHNDRLGFPGVQELHDFPVIDHLHFAILWLMGRFGDVVVVYNLYYLLTYPLIALTAMAAFRRLKLTLPAAAVGALLYAFLPYHHVRWEHHYFLSAYWLVPLALVPAVEICRGVFPFFRREPDGTDRFRPWSWSAAGLVLLGAATASAGAYYAFFACLIYAAAGVYGWVMLKDRRAMASAVLLAGIIGVFGVLNHLPAFAYHAKYGPNPVAARDPEEADVYGLKVAHLLLPINEHNLTVLGQLRARYSTTLRALTAQENENGSAGLGLVGGVGFLVLVGLLLMPTRKRWPYGPLTALAGFITLFACIGGFGGLFNFLVFDQVRCHNRISVYLALLCFYAALWPLDKFLLTRTGRWRKARYPVLAAVGLVAFLDQTPYSWFRDGIVKYTTEERERYEADHAFFAAVEQLAPGAKVFTLPYVPYPEYPPLYKMANYEPVRGYLHTDSLVLSYGAIKGREADAWQKDVAAHDPTPQWAAEFVRRVVVRGFDGVIVDTRGYLTTRAGGTGLHVLHLLKRAAEAGPPGPTPEVVHPDGRQFFLDLRPYRDWLRRQSPAYFEAEAAREREWATVLWLKGFYSAEPLGQENHLRWCAKTGVAVVVNPSDRTRRFRLSMRFGVDGRGEFHVRIDGGQLWSDEFDLEKPPGAWDPGVRDFGPHKEYVLEVPPGRHVVTFRCRPPQTFTPTDHRPLCFYILDFRMEEMR